VFPLEQIHPCYIVSLVGQHGRGTAFHILYKWDISYLKIQNDFSCLNASLHNVHYNITKCHSKYQNGQNLMNPYIPPKISDFRIRQHRVFNNNQLSNSVILIYIRREPYVVTTRGRLTSGMKKGGGLSNSHYFNVHYKFNTFPMLTPLSPFYSSASTRVRLAG
jgi:hypothetical protein